MVRYSVVGLTCLQISVVSVACTSTLVTVFNNATTRLLLTLSAQQAVAQAPTANAKHDDRTTREDDALHVTHSALQYSYSNCSFFTKEMVIG